MLATCAQYSDVPWDAAALAAEAAAAPFELAAAADDAAACSSFSPADTCSAIHEVQGKLQAKLQSAALAGIRC